MEPGRLCSAKVWSTGYVAVATPEVAPASHSRPARRRTAAVLTDPGGGVAGQDLAQAGDAHPVGRSSRRHPVTERLEHRRPWPAASTCECGSTGGPSLATASVGQAAEGAEHAGADPYPRGA